MRSQTIILLSFILIGFALRLLYLTTTHPFFDEYTTVLAARQILRLGWPRLPSGLFYEHGLLATYLIAPFTALFINNPPTQWQPAHWGLMLARWPSLLLGTATIPLILAVGRRLGPAQPATRTAALLAAGLFALSPEGMVWGGRARMYALASLLLLLTVFWAYRGARRPAARYRWLALAALLATLLTQFGAMLLVPPLMVGMILIGWRYRNGRPWFLRRTVFLEGSALVAVIGLAILVKRLGRPLGFTPLANSESAGLLTELLRTVAYQTTLYFTWPDTVQFLARQFGVPHHLWLTLAALLGLLIALAWSLIRRGREGSHPSDPSALAFSPFALFLWLVFGLIVLEVVLLLEPFRRNPRYLVMYLPLFYLATASALVSGLATLATVVARLGGWPRLAGLVRSPLTALLLLAPLVALGFNDLRVALLTPEPAYEAAFAHVQAQWQPGDALLTMNTPAAGLFLGDADGFTVQVDADQFLLETPAGPVDRWLGAPWLGAPADFAAALNRAERSWFVIDTIRQPVYFRGNWQAVVNTQLEQVWAQDNALVYRTRPERRPLPSAPQTRLEALLGNSLEFVGFTLHRPPPESTQRMLAVTFFWRPLAPLAHDYTTFLHLRNQAGQTVAQLDSQPLAGAYPTSHWQPDEMVIDPRQLPLPADLPSGRYTLLAGMYRLDTLERLPVTNDTSGENAVELTEVRLP